MIEAYCKYDKEMDLLVKDVVNTHNSMEAAKHQHIERSRSAKCTGV